MVDGSQLGFLSQPRSPCAYQAGAASAYLLSLAKLRSAKGSRSFVSAVPCAQSISTRANSPGKRVEASSSLLHSPCFDGILSEKELLHLTTASHRIGFDK